MRKIFVILLILISGYAIGQPSNYLYNKTRYRFIAAMADSTFHIPSGASNSLRVGGYTAAGALFYNTTDSSVYVWTGTQWLSSGGGFANPMTTAGDLIVGGASGTPQRFAMGTANQLIRVNSGGTALEYFTPTYILPGDTASMLANYLRTAGDLSPLFTTTESSNNIAFSQVTQSANTVFAGPTTGGAANPTFRSLVAADIPDLSTAYIQNQQASDQTANFRISGNGRFSGSIYLPSSSGTNGNIYKNGFLWMHNGGSTYNLFWGQTSGNTSSTNTFAVGIGPSAQAQMLNSDNPITILGMRGPAIDCDNCIGIGSGTLDSITVGASEIAIGKLAMRRVRKSIGSVIIGASLTMGDTLSFVTQIGSDGPVATDYVQDHVGIGAYNQQSMTRAVGRTSVGVEALQTLTEGSFTTTYGYKSAELATSADSAVIIGPFAAQTETTIDQMLVIANNPSTTHLINGNFLTDKVAINKTLADMNSGSANFQVGGTGAFDGDVTVPDEAYGAGWDGSLEVPTKNAIYDKIETISGGGGSGTVNSGTQYRLAYYASTGTAVSEAGAITANRALISDANGVPTHSSVTNTELGYVSGVTSALQTQIDAKAPIASPTFTGTPAAPTASAGTNTTQIATTAFVLNQFGNPAWAKAVQDLGGDMKYPSLGVDISTANVSTAMTDGQVRMQVVYIDKPTTITGVRFFMRTQGNFTADNTNRVVLMSYSGGTWTEVATTANDGDIWKAASNTYNTCAFTSPYAAGIGTYAVFWIWNSSSTTSAPALGAGPNLGNSGMASPNLTNSAQITAFLNSQTDITSPQAASGLSAATSMTYFYLY